MLSREYFSPLAVYCFTSASYFSYLICVQVVIVHYLLLANVKDALQIFGAIPSKIDPCVIVWKVIMTVEVAGLK